jgi:hypothetical protein
MSSQIAVFRSLIDFSESQQITKAELSTSKLNDNIYFTVRMSFKIAKTIFKNMEEEDDDDEYKVVFRLQKDVLVAQYDDHSEKLIKPVFSPLKDALQKVRDEKMSIDKVDLKKMKQAVSEYVEEKSESKSEEKSEGKSQDIAFEAQDEMLQLIESSLGNMAALINKKTKDQMSLSALETVLKSIVKITLTSAGVEDETMEEKAWENIKTQGFLPKKADRKTGRKSGYTLFTEEVRADEKFKKDNEGKKFTEITGVIAAMWKALSEEKKEKYKEKAQQHNKDKPQSKKPSKKSSKKGSQKPVSEHTCTYIITKSERAGTMCGSSIRSDEPTFEGQWFCSKHASAQKKKSESRKKKEEKESEKPKKKTKKTDDEEKSEKPKKKTKKTDEEEKSEKPKKKTTKKTDEEEKSEKPKKKTKKTDEEEKSEKPKKKAEKKEEVVEQEEAEEALTQIAMEEFEFNSDDKYVQGIMTGESLTQAFGEIFDEMEEDQYNVNITTTERQMIVTLLTEDGEEIDSKKVKLAGASDELKTVSKFLLTM